METWFVNHVLGLSLSVLLLGLPGPLGAGTPSNNSTDAAAAGFYSSVATGGLSDSENNETSTSYSSESLSPSQRNILLTHTAETHAAAAAAHHDTEQTQTSAETSSRSLEAVSRSTEPLISTLVVATTEASSSISSSSSSISSSSGSISRSIGSSGISSSSIGSSSIASSSISSSGISSSSIGSSSISSSGTSSSSISSSSISSSSISSSSISSSGTSSSSISSSGISSSGTSSSSISSSSISSSGISSSGTSSSGISSSGTSSSSISSSSISSSSISSSRDRKDLTNTDQVSDASSSVSWEASSWKTENTRMPQDSPDTTLRQGDAPHSMSHTAVHTDSTYSSTTISRAGERTLMSVTSSSSNSTSSAFTEDSNSHQPPSTSGVSARATETEDYTHSALSTRTDSEDMTDTHMTHSFSERGSPEGPRGTHSFNMTHHQHTSTSEETPDSTPPLRVTWPSTDQSEASVSSTPPVTAPAEGPTNISGTDQESRSSLGTSTESSTGVHSSSTQNQEGTDGVSSQTSEQTVGFGLTTGPPTVSSTSEMDDSLTDTPVLVHDVFLSTTPVTVTERPHITEENTFQATASTSTTTAPLPLTSSSSFSRTTTSSSSAPEPPTESTIMYIEPSTTASTPALQTSAVLPTHRVSSSQTQGPSTGMANPTKATTLQIETSTGSLGVTTARGQRITTTYTHSTPTKSTAAPQTTGKQTERRTTEQMVTTTPTDVRSTKAPPPLPPPRNPCVSNPCMNGGMCVSGSRNQYTCRCQKAWTGPNCTHDVDECKSHPCPAGSRCVNTRGSFNCECPLGFDLEDGRSCTRAKTFLGTFSVNRKPHDPVVFKSTTMHEIQREIIQLLNASLSVLRGYSRSLLSKKGEDGVRITAVNMFSVSTNVTSAEVYNSIQMSLSNCSSSLAHCRMVLHHQLTYHVESLCVAQKTQCDTERSTCTDTSGTARCQCFQGYYKHNPDDLSCLECGDGYKLENGTCVPCMFGFGGFNCGNFYKLIAVVVSPAGGALLLILIIALIVTCCKKDKNDINKIIFKSGDLQMSPYADFPKNNRISMEWGRETIEMQENGSTKNLLQMTDIYYSPALRNSDLERNGLYPFTGLPGSRHSCIYPAQWNPSFISDDSRRRDYF